MSISCPHSPLDSSEANVTPTACRWLWDVKMIKYWEPTWIDGCPQIKKNISKMYISYQTFRWKWKTSKSSLSKANYMFYLNIKMIKNFDLISLFNNFRYQKTEESNVSTPICHCYIRVIIEFWEREKWVTPFEARTTPRKIWTTENLPRKKSLRKWLFRVYTLGPRLP